MSKDWWDSDIDASVVDVDTGKICDPDSQEDDEDGRIALLEETIEWENKILQEMENEMKQTTDVHFTSTVPTVEGVDCVLQLNNDDKKLGVRSVPTVEGVDFILQLTSDDQKLEIPTDPTVKGVDCVLQLDSGDQKLEVPTDRTVKGVDCVLQLNSGNKKLGDQRCKIQSLMKEIRQLRRHCQDQQATIELIMTKYRQHISELTRLKTESDLKVAATQKIALQMITEESRKQLEKVEEMKLVLQAALNTDQNIFMRNEELIAQLAMENKHLRELLEAVGGGTLRDLNKNTVDKSIQTEDDDQMDHKKGISNSRTRKQTGSGDIVTIDEAEETENEDSADDDSCSFYSAVDFDSDSC